MSQQRRIFLAACVAGVIAAASAATALSADAVSEESTQFATDAARLSETLVRSAELANRESQDEAVRAFATRLRSESANVNQALMAICRRKGIKLPAPASGATSGALPDASGQTFDRIFSLEVSQALARADTLFSAASSSPKIDEELKAFARQSREALLKLAGPASQLAKQQGGVAGQSR